jgi:hypothetical protein
MKHAYDLHPLFAREMGLLPLPLILRTGCSRVVNTQSSVLSVNLRCAGSGSYNASRVRACNGCGLSMRMANATFARYGPKAPADVGFPTSSLNT